METKFACFQDVGDGDAPSLSQRRNQLYAEFVQRAKNMVLIQSETKDLIAPLNTLLDANVLFFNRVGDDRFDICYGPSSVAANTLSNSIPRWSDKIAARIKKSLRSSSGAICKLEVDGSDEHVDVFVTDWSSCTGACALALHAYHPFVRTISYHGGSGNYFTGRYVRNPLTGDLMSIWVADWVKPDFGTGAVLVNPAHNRADLEFARRVGLPIRFALSLQQDVDEYSRPVPPVLKTGFAIRTGFLDGKWADQVHNETLNVLLRKGVAIQHEDNRLPSQVIGRIELLVERDESCQFWNRSTGEFILANRDTAGNPDIVPVRLTCHPVFQAAVTAVLFKPEYLQVDSTTSKNHLIVLAPLIYDLAGLQGFVPLEILEPAEYAGQRDIDEAMKLALLVGEAPGKVLVVRKTLLEQVESFRSGVRAVHTKLAKDGEVPPVAVYTALERADPVGAFKELYHWQKHILGTDLPVHADRYLSVLGTLGVERFA
ncbi:class I tRNA ligase family protein [Burkholderia sp. BCC0405]|uniref:class I tRNA ligase family protein n=1 Tax=Burkholderia sp. BCC0405 TaxID=2676298 RepID=UPI00158BB6F0|nr:class I tRNA ligase family protein [Burkholderia sp. BCC0405]